MDLNFSGRVTEVVVVEEVSQVGQARRAAQALADAIGFDEVDAGRVALAATELATNLIKHARGGRMYLSVVCGRGGDGVELHTLDAGPGFSLAQSLPDGYSTGGTQGQGLGAIQRQATVLDGQSVALTLIDGLGHGLSASDAAQAGVAAVARRGDASPPDVIAAMHAGMSGTRGGAAAVARVDVANGAVQFAGIGNIAAALHEPTSTRGMASHPGIVGVQFRKAQPFHFHAPAGTLLLMHSDGLQARWNLRDYPGLLHRHPALIVAVLQRDFDRGRDDTGIVALRLGDLH